MVRISEDRTSTESSDTASATYTCRIYTWRYVHVHTRVRVYTRIHRHRDLYRRKVTTLKKEETRGSLQSTPAGDTGVEREDLKSPHSPPKGKSCRRIERVHTCPYLWADQGHTTGRMLAPLREKDRSLSIHPRRSLDTSVHLGLRIYPPTYLSTWVVYVSIPLPRISICTYVVPDPHISVCIYRPGWSTYLSLSPIHLSTYLSVYSGGMRTRGSTRICRCI